MNNTQKGKVCLDCNEDKLLEEFSKSKSHKFGRQTRCKICFNKNKQAQKYIKNKEDYYNNHESNLKKGNKF